MTRSFERLSLADFAELLSRFPFRRKINAVHMHHTWRPNHAQYRGHQTIVSMWRYHTQEQGWSDIAQHISIAPDGTIWLGRNWNLPPASARGHNGNSEAGPFMFEMIGDFDPGRDPFQDPQRGTVLEVIARVQRRFGLPPESLRFHNQMSSKSCPGHGIEYQEIVEAVRGLHGRLAKEAADGARGTAREGPFGEDAYRVMDVIRHFELEAPSLRDPPDAEPNEGEPMMRGPDARRGLEPTDHAALRPHVVNLVQGRFSDDGRFTTARGDVDAIFDQHLAAALAAARARQDKLRIMVYAHGGLVSESNALAMAHAQRGWWMRNHVYPLYFVWETGLFETIGQVLSRSRAVAQERVARDFVTDVSDSIIEAAARVLGGRKIWSSMKRHAERSSDAEGGARYVAERLGRFCQANKKEVELHAVGHSAGAIFHSHFLPACLDAQTPAFRTVSFLAPRSASMTSGNVLGRWSATASNASVSSRCARIWNWTTTAPSSTASRCSTSSTTLSNRRCGLRSSVSRPASAPTRRSASCSG
ncbi:peptidoglycan recognition protein family protein [Azospirillum argentinense]|nr:peptidoglycan recognition family protein [Azospirillum argentinense]